jgi:chromosome segregation ATPase
MGKDGAHVIIPSVELVSELSLVTRGAAKHAKILDKVYQMAMSEENTSVINLTKQEVRNDLLKINLCSTISKEVDMNSEDIKAAVLAATEPLAEEIKTMQSTLASLGEEKKALEAAKGEAENAKVALEEANSTLTQEKSELESALAEAKKKADDIKAAFDAEIQKVLVAAGLSENIPEDLEGKMELLNKSHLILSAIPVDGVASRADHLKTTAAKVDFSAFKVK